MTYGCVRAAMRILGWQRHARSAAAATFRLRNRDGRDGLQSWNSSSGSSQELFLVSHPLQFFLPGLLPFFNIPK